MSEQEENDKQQQAEVLLHRLIQEIDDDPNNYHTYYDLSALLIELKSYTQAEELLIKALGLFGDRGRKTTDTLTYGLGNVYYAAGEYQKAIEQYGKVKDQKLQKDAYLMVAQSYMGTGNHKLALAFALTAGEHSQQDPAVNQLIADNFLALGHFKEAADYFDRVLASQPRNGRAQFDRGITAVILEQDATRYFEQAKQLDAAYYKKGQQRLADIQGALNQRQKESTDN